MCPSLLLDFVAILVKKLIKCVLVFRILQQRFYVFHLHNLYQSVNKQASNQTSKQVQKKKKNQSINPHLFYVEVLKLLMKKKGIKCTNILR